jgi:hypothetical protein
MKSFHPEQIALFHELVLQRFGLVFDQTRENLVSEILEARSAELNMTASEYLAALNSHEEEWNRLAELGPFPRHIFFAAWITFVYLKKSCCQRAWRQMEPAAI